jgi:hypothetical protein
MLVISRGAMIFVIAASGTVFAILATTWLRHVQKLRQRERARFDRGGFPVGVSDSANTARFIPIPRPLRCADGKQ